MVEEKGPNSKKEVIAKLDEWHQDEVYLGVQQSYPSAQELSRYTYSQAKQLTIFLNRFASC